MILFLMKIKVAEMALLLLERSEAHHRFRITAMVVSETVQNAHYRMVEIQFRKGKSEKIVEVSEIILETKFRR